MKFHETRLSGCWLIEIEPVGDRRGFFARTFCARAFAERGLPDRFVQTSHSFNAGKGTLRGLHFQNHPMMEDKLVRCLRGAIFDVMVDLRVGSPTFGAWIGYELTEDDNRQLFAPKGFAHGFQTLSDNAVVGYQISPHYEAACANGLLWNDPQVGVDWPLPPAEQSERDLGLPLLSDLDLSLLIPFAESRA